MSFLKSIHLLLIIMSIVSSLYNELAVRVYLCYNSTNRVKPFLLTLRIIIWFYVILLLVAAFIDVETSSLIISSGIFSNWHTAVVYFLIISIYLYFQKQTYFLLKENCIVPKIFFCFLFVASFITPLCYYFFGYKLLAIVYEFVR